MHIFSQLCFVTYCVVIECCAGDCRSIIRERG